MIEENPDFDRKEKLEHKISEASKQMQGQTSGFAKFKSDYFSATEPICNKDVSTLKLATIKVQQSKLSKISEKINET